MKYMMLIYGDENAWTQSELEDCYEESLQLVEQLRASGHYLSSAPLHSVTTATSIQVRDGKKIVTDGPFAETREQLGGYYLIDAENLDEAIAIAERIPAAGKGTVEIRPIVALPGLPLEK
ncbi:MAG: YciI family protein [Lyngbya sp. HA4199-MV5]|jgi:hypothetical protein|nr:YciI family protein [Lyngbya sp. HA4199-MV5]